jgi:hypothetical protein
MSLRVVMTMRIDATVCDVFDTVLQTSAAGARRSAYS